MKQHDRTLYDVTATTPAGRKTFAVYGANAAKARARAETLLGQMHATFTIETIAQRPAQKR